MALLTVSNLHVTFPSSRCAVRGLSLSVEQGEIHAIVGESGAGKSVTVNAIAGLLPPSAQVRVDQLQLGELSLSDAGEKGLQKVRGRLIAMVFQEPAKHLNPALTIGALIGEALRYHLGLSRAGARERARGLMATVELDCSALDAYPHQLSGGMQQRALIALAISCGPELLLADEPTTALDATVQGQILALLDRLRRDVGMGVLLVSHDLGVVQQVADTVSVIYAGRVVESAPAGQIFSHPIHPYTELLLRAIPSAAGRGRPLDAIPGRVPDSARVPQGCAFHPRCPIAGPECATDAPELAELRRRHHVSCHRASSVVLAQETT